MNADALLAASVLLAYIFGSIPFGLIFARLAGAGDVRNVGSGNIGATNVLRTGSKWAAGATLLFDMGKGAAAVLITRMYAADWVAFAGVGAVVGHIFPVWLRFHGGKGVATFLGVVFALDLRVGLASAATWILAAAWWRISSLAALIAAAATPLYFTVFDNRSFILPVSTLSVLILITHRENVQRLLRGEEPRIGPVSSTRHP